jgi:iron complex outermembrane receptor protein
VFVPQINLSYQLNQLQLRASAGYAYRNADFTELYNNYNRTGIRSGSIGNPNLNPEKSFNYEFGFDWITTADSKISLSAFSRNSKDLIDWTLTPYVDMPRKENLVVAGNYLLAKNQSSIHVEGIELDYLLDKKINSNQSIKFKSGLIWINTENKNGPLSFYLSSAPKFLANFATTFSTKQIDFNLTGLYKSRNGQTANPILLPISNDYFVMNARINFRFNKVKHMVFIQADNLFNSTINDFIGAPLPGRWLQAGARLFFN